MVFQKRINDKNSTRRQDQKYGVTVYVHATSMTSCHTEQNVDGDQNSRTQITVCSNLTLRHDYMPQHDQYIVSTPPERKHVFWHRSCRLLLAA